MLISNLNSNNRLGVVKFYFTLWGNITTVFHRESYLLAFTNETNSL